MSKEIRRQVYEALALPMNFRSEAIQEILEWATQNNVTDVNRIVEEVRANDLEETVETPAHLRDHKAPQGSSGGNNCLQVEMQYDGTRDSDFIRWEY